MPHENDRPAIDGFAAIALLVLLIAAVGGGIGIFLYTNSVRQQLAVAEQARMAEAAARHAAEVASKQRAALSNQSESNTRESPTPRAETTWKTITLDANGTPRIGNQSLSREELRETVTSGNLSGKQFELQPVDNCPFEYIARVIQLFDELGIQQPRLSRQEHEQ